MFQSAYGQYNVTPASEMLMLGVGQPSPQILKDANNFIKLNELEGNDINLLQYGLKQGFPSYRKFVKKLLNTFSSTLYYDEIKEDNIYMTNGISQAVFMIASLLKTTYDTIYVEDLTYFIMINVFKDIKYNIKTFNVSDLYKLKTDLENEKGGALVYLIPFCNNPTGKSMSLENIEHFSSILPKNCLCLSDETYQFLHFDKNTFNKSLALYSDNIISLGTFSKILAPGVRLGWMYTNYNFNCNHFYKFLNETGFMDSGGSVNPLIAHMITNYISGNFDAYKNFIETVKLDLEDKQKIII